MRERLDSDSFFHHRKNLSPGKAGRRYVSIQSNALSLVLCTHANMPAKLDPCPVPPSCILAQVLRNIHILLGTRTDRWRT